MPEPSTASPPPRGRPTSKLTAATLAVLIAGTTAVAVASSPAAAVVPEPIATAVVDTSELAGTPTGVALTDEAIFVETTTGAGRVVQWRPRSGGEWSGTWGGVELAGELEAAENDVVQLGQSGHDLLVWARDGGGSREVPTGTELGHGAEYVIVTRDTHYEVQHIQSDGLVLKVGPLRSSHQILGDVLRELYLSADLKSMQFSDLDLGTGTSGYLRSYRCNDAVGGRPVLEDADARNSLVRCPDGTALLIDHQDVYLTTTLADHTSPGSLLLGDGFALSTHLDTDVVTVATLYQERRGSLGKISDPDLDESGTNAVLLGDDQTVRLADLGEWSAELATTSAETVAPTSTVSVSGTTLDSSYSVSVSARDAISDETYYPTKIALIETQFRTQAADANEPSPWSAGETFTDTASSHINAEAPEDATVCWRARATDAAGNQGDWSEVACGVIDRVQRLAGATRYETAVAISQATFEPGVSDVYVATGADFPDALAGAAAAGSKDSPVLLVKRGSVPAPVADEIRRLAPRRIVVLGGTGVISDAVAAELREFAPVTRIGGRDRYETAALVSRDAYEPLNGSQFVSMKVASGSTFPDALAAASAKEYYDRDNSRYVHAPLLLTRKDRVPTSTRREIRRIDPAFIYVVGGTGAVANTALYDLHDILDTDGDGLPDYDTPDTGGGVGRFEGSDRYETAARLVTYFSPGRKVAYVATGQSFPDALTGAAAARANNAPLVMVKPGSIPAASRRQLERLNPRSIVVLGGDGAVSAGVEAQLADFVG